MADASGNPADGYYSGRPLGYDPQQAQAEAVPPAPRQAIAGEQANGVPAPQRQPRQDVGEQVPNHTHVHGVPGYYKGRVNNTNTAVAPLSAAATVAPTAAPAVEPERKLSWVDKCLMCFTGGRNAR
ncbi:hypothetical protein BDA96_05G095800 [Sorghum bicolor]|uniref:Uncharacterized protein n=3 Tax=Sorghum bicolor TaxID=4558 RepID=A0A921UFA0_SORBI|nr:hypothetical protein BDA96_05G095800 [Sorghum bicolor]KXG28169.1 hypothetical protein SORBI_3005G093000 [Sorghum bicolor]